MNKIYKNILQKTLAVKGEIREKAEESVQNLFLILDALFGENNYQVIKLKGFSLLNPLPESLRDEKELENTYKKAKTPAGKTWKGIKSLSLEEAVDWTAQGGWLGLIMPEGYVVVDIDIQKIATRVARGLLEQKIEHVAIQTPRGCQFVFKSTGNIKKQWTKKTTAILAKVDYRIGGQGYIVLPTVATVSREFTKTSTDLAEIPIYFWPLKKVDEDNLPALPIEQGARNDSLFRHASRLYSNSFSEEQVYKIISFINKYLTEEPLPEEEIQTVAKKREEYNYNTEDIENIEEDMPTNVEVLQEVENDIFGVKTINKKKFLVKLKKKTIKTEMGKLTVYVVTDVLGEHFTVARKLVDENDNKYIVLKNENTKKEAVISADAHKKLDTETLSSLVGLVDSESKKGITKYIRIISTEVEESSDVRSSTGWNKNQTHFYLPTKSGCYWIERLDRRFEQMFSVKGDASKQEELIKYVLERKAGIAMLAALSAPLIRVLDVPGFVVYLASPTRTGKTTANRVAMGMFGNPDMLMYSMNITNVALEIVLDSLHDIPVWIDEIETLTHSKGTVQDFINLVYNATQGVARQRATSNIKMRQTARYKGVLLSSGEKSLEMILNISSGVNKALGVLNRVLEIEDSDLWDVSKEKTISICREVNQVVFANYGHVGIKYLTYLEQVDKNRIRETFEDKLKKVIQAGEHAYILATLLVALDTLRTVLNDTNIGTFLEKWIIEKLILKATENRKNTDIRENFLNDFMDYVIAHLSDEMKIRDDKRNVIGTTNIEKDNTFVVEIISREFKNIVEKELKLPANQILKSISDLIDSSSKGFRRTIRINGVPVSGYRLRLPLPENININKLLEEEGANAEEPDKEISYFEMPREVTH